MSEWSVLRAGFLLVGLLVVAALVGWGAHTMLDEDEGFAQLSACLRNEKGLSLLHTHDPIAQSAELGALRTVVETNGVTISVAGDRSAAERIVAAYRSVGGNLTGRLEQRGRLVYLWDREASPTQRQALYDCTY